MSIKRMIYKKIHKSPLISIGSIVKEACLRLIFILMDFYRICFIEFAKSTLTRRQAYFRAGCKIYIAQFLFLACAVTSQAQNQIVKFDHITMQDGINEPHILTFHQDSRGFIWFGTYNGLHRYDGYNIKLYLPVEGDTTSISSPVVYEIAEDANGNMWIGTIEGLNRYNKTTGNFKRFGYAGNEPSVLKDLHIRHIHFESDSILWIATYYSGLFRYNKHKQSIKQFIHNENDTNSLPSNRVNTFYVDFDNDYWVGTEHGGLSLFNKETGTFTHFLPEPGNPESKNNDIVSAITQTSDSIFWIGTWNGGLNKFDKKKGWIKKFKPEEGNANSLSTNTVREIVPGAEGNLWLATFGGGIDVFNPKKQTFRHFKNSEMDSHTISHDFVWTLFFDDAGLLWIGTFGNGINILDKGKQKFPLYQKEQGAKNTLSGNKVTAAFQDSQGFLWLGTLGNGLNRLNLETGVYTHYLTNTQTYENRIRGISEDSNENLWVATDYGVVRYKPGRNKMIHYTANQNDTTSLLGDPVYDICEDSDGNIWITVWGEGVNRINKEDLDKPPEQTPIIAYPKGVQQFGMPYMDVYDILCTQTGRLIFMSDWGVMEYKKHINRFDSVFRANARCAVELSNGEILIGTIDRGIVRLSHSLELISVLSKKDGLPFNSIYAIVEDNNQNLWLSSDKGLIHFQVDEISFQTYNKNDGVCVNTLGMKSGTKLNTGQIVFGGTGGYNLFYPHQIKENKYAPPIAITGFYLFNHKIEYGKSNEFDFTLDKTITETEKITLNYNQNFFHFEFAALSYSFTPGNTYSYMLEGFDEGWVHTNAGLRMAFYTGVPPGDYVFMVKAANSDGYWNNDPRKIRIVITPPFWQTWWFRITAGLLLAGGIIGFYYLRLRQMRSRNKELERMVQERTHELQEANVILEERQEEILLQNEEISSINENLDRQFKKLKTKNRVIKQQNKLITGSIRYAKTIQNAMLPIKSKMNKVFENFVIFKPKDVVSGDFYWYARQEQGTPDEKIFVTVVDCTGHGVPGAFMSMIGSSLLNEIIRVRNVSQPIEILNLLDLQVNQILKQRDTENTDGMDLCLCRITHDNEKYNVVFAGAKRPVFYTDKNGKIIRLTGSRRGIGGLQYGEIAFEEKTVNLKKGDMLYLTSDGFTDQNNAIRKNYGTRRFIAVLNRIKHLSLNEQKIELERELKEHQENEIQRDDITVMGIRL